MAIGRISGQLLKDNLLRDGVNLKFESNLLYLDVNSHAADVAANPTDPSTWTGNIGIRTSNPAYPLDVNGTINSTISRAGQLLVDDVTIDNSTVTTSVGNLTLRSATTADRLYLVDPTVQGDLLPDTNDLQTLGNENFRWKEAYFQDIFVNGISIGTGSGSVPLITDELDKIYVQLSGSDAGGDGTSIAAAYRTVKYALSQATSGQTIVISPGVYEEVFPLTVPQGVQVIGAGLRATTIVPTLATNDNDCFLLNGETTVQDLTIRDMFYDSGNDTGYAFRFAPNCEVALRSPYIQRITVLNRGSNSTISDPYGYASADAGRGVLIDGAQVTRSSLEAAMLFNECTFIVPNSRALIMTNGARTEWLNCFTYFADLAIEGKVGITGRGNDGKTYLTFGGVSGSGFQVGETIQFVGTGGTPTVNIVVESVNGEKVTVDGNFSSLAGVELTPGAGGSITGLTSLTTATTISRYDRAEFAAEMRAISGANVYGNQGIKADGADVVLQLMAWNFAYIGTGADLTNNKSAVVQANEVIELNSGRVYYNSVDQVGNYRVGDLFSVNFETGAVSFAAPEFNIESLTGITFTDGTNTTIVNPVGIETGNLVIAGNTISSVSGNIILDPNTSSTLIVNSPAQINGNVVIDSTGFLKLPVGDTSQRVGPAEVGQIRYNSQISSFEGYGSGGWASLGGVKSVDGLTYIVAETSAGASNDELEFYAAVDNLTTSKVGGWDKNRLLIETDADIQGTLTVDGQTTLASLNVEDLTATRLVYAGVDGELVDSANLTFDGTKLLITGDAEITGDLTIGGNITIGDQPLDTITVAADFTSDLIPAVNNTYDLGTSTESWRTLYVSQTSVGTLEITDDGLTQTAVDGNITLTPNGSGTIIIDTTTALKLPVGTTAERPTVAVTGEVRFNTDDKRVENFDGTAWNRMIHEDDAISFAIALG